jgi:Ca2+-binding RTX toxin-like protein
VLVGVVFGSALLVPASSFGAVSCQYNGSSKHLEVFESSPTTIIRNGSAIQINSGSNPVACSGGPTVTNTDAIIVFDSAPANFSYQVTIDLSGGPFAPGADNEGGSNDEIEIELQDVESAEFKGSSGVDNWRFGSDGANLNGASEANFLTPGVDTDVTFLASTDRVRMDTGGSSDVVRGNGGLGAGTPFPIPMRIFGGAGDDQLTGGDASDTIAFQGAISTDPGNDTTVGGAGADVIGSDAGNDTVDGGPGDDLVEYFNAPAGVTLDLAVPGQQNTGGGGLDTVSGIESVDGSQFADTLLGDGGANLLTGRTGGDTLDGRAGVDVLDGDGLAAFGADILNVRDGGPDTATCGPEADVISADVQGVDAIAADCETVDFAPFVQPPDDGGGGDGGGSGVDVSIKAKKRQDVVDRGALTVRAGCPAVDCQAKVTGAIRLPKGGGKSARAARKVKLRPVSESLAAGAPEKLKLALPRKGEKRVVRAMTTRSRLPALVTVDVTDGNGNQGTASAKVKVVD